RAVPPLRLRRAVRAPDGATIGWPPDGRPELPGHDPRARGLLGRPGLRPHAAVPHGARRGDDESGHLPALPRPQAVARRIRRAGDPADRRTLWGEPVSLPALLPVPGRPQALAAGRARPLPRLAPPPRDRARAPRRPPRRGRLGEPDDRRLGPRLGGLDGRHGGHAVDVLPAARRPRR